MPTGPSGIWRGMRVSMTLTTPPIADEPNSKADGPRSTSIRSAVSGLIAIAWSGPDEDRSRLPMPSVSTRTRSPDKPRRTGAEASGPKLVADTPGWLASVSPMLGRSARVRSAWSSTEDSAEHVAGVAADAGDDDFVVMVAMGVGVGGGLRRRRRNVADRFERRDGAVIGWAATERRPQKE